MALVYMRFILGERTTARSCCSRILHRLLLLLSCLQLMLNGCLLIVSRNQALFPGVERTAGSCRAILILVDKLTCLGTHLRVGHLTLHSLQDGWAALAQGLYLNCGVSTLTLFRSRIKSLFHLFLFNHSLQIRAPSVSANRRGWLLAIGIKVVPVGGWAWMHESIRCISTCHLLLYFRLDALKDVYRVGGLARARCCRVHCHHHLSPCVQWMILDTCLDYAWWY